MIRKKVICCGLLIGLALLWPSPIYAASGGGQAALDLTDTWAGELSLIIFVVAYALVISEEYLHKLTPVMVAVGGNWQRLCTNRSWSGSC